MVRSTPDAAPAASLSILIPFFGREDFLREAVGSVMNQSDPRWSLTVVDDANPDVGASSWVAEIGDPRVTLIRNSANRGVSGNFNRCVELASTTWVVFLGSDDRLLPDYVAVLLDAIAEHPESDLLIPQSAVIDHDGEPVMPLIDRVKRRRRARLDRSRPLSGEAAAASIVGGNWVYFPSVCWKVDTIRRYRFDADFSTVQDLKLMLDIFLAGGVATLVDAEVFEYRRHDASVSSRLASTGDRFEQEATVFALARAAFARLGWRRAARSASAHLTSRLHAATALGARLARFRFSGSGALLRHALGSTASLPPRPQERP